MTRSLQGAFSAKTADSDRYNFIGHRPLVAVFGEAGAWPLARRHRHSPRRVFALFPRNDDDHHLGRVDADFSVLGKVAGLDPR